MVILQIFFKETLMNTVFLNFIKDIMMSSLNVGTYYLVPPYDNLEELDQGIMKVLWNHFDYNNATLKSILNNVEEDVIYYYQSTLEQNYFVFKIRNPKSRELLVIGPYLIEDPSSMFYERIITRNRILESSIHALKTYYSTVPVIDEITANKTAYTIASYLFQNYDPDNIKRFEFNENLEYQSKSTNTLNFVMKVLEDRYNLENRLLDAIKKGDADLALQYVTEMSKLNLPPRVDNPVRNTKNNLFILNTLCRKAAEAGKVHPVYLDQISSEFAVQIERNNDNAKLNSMVAKMTYRYCLLVKNYSLSQYSHIVRKTINYIRLNISSPLSLKVLADNFGTNASYLSAQFKKETNRTITDYIHQERINAAIQLLNTTNLSMQEIAFRVGIDDYNYFSKIFKKQVGMSPLQYSNMMHE